MQSIPAFDAVMQVAAACDGEYGTIAGGATAAATYSTGMFYPEDILGIPDIEYQWGDVDVFASTKASAVSITKGLLMQGYVLDPKHVSTWRRWRKFEMSNKWETHSIKLESLNGIEVNVIAKSVHGVPCRDPWAVAGSFDFGHLTTVFDLETMEWIDLRHAMIKGFQPGQGKEFDMLTRRIPDWRSGLFSPHIGNREPGRYARYVTRGFTGLMQAKDTLATGYEVAALHYSDKDDPADKWRGDVFYPAIADAIRADDFDQLLELEEKTRTPSGLALLMEELV